MIPSLDVDLVCAAANLLSPAMAMPTMMPSVSGSMSRQISLVPKSHEMNLHQDDRSDQTRLT
jgi:hypothetical protein